ncbi:MAG: metallophosphoesterase [Ferruginibacter sp.]
MGGAIIMKTCLFSLLLFFAVVNVAAQQNSTGILQFVFTSDAHYGINRTSFRGQQAVDGHTVNAAMVQQINSLPGIVFPKDSGIAAGQSVGAVDFLVQGGDIANRMEIPNQSAADSWMQFDTDYIKGITLTDHAGKKAGLMVVPGNHDITNAIGFYKPMKPATDASSMANIYNLMLNPKVPLTKETYSYSMDKINYSKNIGGIHFMFITLWPDSAERVWMKKDLRSVRKKTPVFIFTHDPPECEAKHFSNPKPQPFNATDKFENLVAEQYKDASTAMADAGKTTMEQTGWIQFLKKHPNIKAYFHGNSNWNEFYQYTGINKEVSLNTFRVDSPMKGRFSAKDETKVSFHVVTIDTVARMMTVRECLWNTEPSNPHCPIKWGESKTVSF